MFVQNFFTNFFSKSFYMTFERGLQRICINQSLFMKMLALPSVFSDLGFIMVSSKWSVLSEVSQL